RGLSSTVCPRSPPGNPGRDRTATVRCSASTSRNGTHFGNPPNPARNPSFGPDPAVHTRQENPLISTDDVEGSVMVARRKAPTPALPRWRGRERVTGCRRFPPPQAGEGRGGGCPGASFRGRLCREERGRGRA